jgi:dienelactone hydrolase
VLGFFATHDAWVTPEKVSAFAEALDQASVERQIFNYTTEPGFALGAESLRDQAYAQTARERTREFFERHLVTSAGNDTP